MINLFTRVLAQNNLITPTTVESNTSAINLLPPCLRTENAALNADLTCVTQSVAFYMGWLFWAIGFAAFVLIVVAGYQYIMSFGDEAKAGQAKKTLTTAIVGMILAMLAAVVMNFVVDRFQVTITAPPATTIVDPNSDLPPTPQATSTAIRATATAPRATPTVSR